VLGRNAAMPVRLLSTCCTCLRLLCLQDVAKRFPNEQSVVRCELMRLLLAQLTSTAGSAGGVSSSSGSGSGSGSGIKLHLLREPQLAVLLQLGKQCLQAKDSTDEDPDLAVFMAGCWLAAASKAEALTGLGGTPAVGRDNPSSSSSSSSSSGPSGSICSSNTGSSGDWRGQYGSARYALTACAAELLAEAMTVRSPLRIPYRALLETAQAWIPTWQHGSAAAGAAAVAGGSGGGGGQGPAPAGAGGYAGVPDLTAWFPSMQVELADLDALQREAWFFVVAEGMQGHTLGQVAEAERAAVDPAKSPPAKKPRRQQQEQQLVLAFPRCLRPWGNAGSQQQQQQQQQASNTPPQWLPRLFWDAPLLEPLLQDPQQLPVLVEDLLVHGLQYLPPRPDLPPRPEEACWEKSHRKLLFDDRGSSISRRYGRGSQYWSSPAVDAAVGALLKAACLHVAAARDGGGSGSSGDDSVSWACELLHPRPDVVIARHAAYHNKYTATQTEDLYDDGSDLSGGGGSSMDGEEDAATAAAAAAVKHLKRPLQVLLAAWLSAPLLQQALCNPLPASTRLTDGSLLLPPGTAAEEVGRAIAARAQQVCAWLGAPAGSTAAAAAAAGAAGAAATSPAGSAAYLAGPEAVLVHVLLGREERTARCILHVCPWLSQQLQAYSASYLQQAAATEQRLADLDQRLPELQQQPQRQQALQEERHEASLLAHELQARAKTAVAEWVNAGLHLGTGPGGSLSVCSAPWLSEGRPMARSMP